MAAKGIYWHDLYDPYGCIHRADFRPFALVLMVMPVMVFFGVPTVLHFLAGRDGLLLGRDPITIAPAFFPLCYAALLYITAVVCTNRLRSAGYAFWWLLLPGYNLYLLFWEEDRADSCP